jgi:hypothetical protein
MVSGKDGNKSEHGIAFVDRTVNTPNAVPTPRVGASSESYVRRG